MEPISKIEEAPCLRCGANEFSREKEFGIIWVRCNNCHLISDTISASEKKSLSKAEFNNLAVLIANLDVHPVDIYKVAGLIEKALPDYLKEGELKAAIDGLRVDDEEPR